MRRDRMASAASRGTITAKLKRVPLGILLIASALAITGFGSLGAAAYLALDDRSLTFWALGLAGATAPAALYLGYQLLCLRRWAWVAAVSVTVLLLASSVLKSIADREMAGAAAIEIVAELLVLAYLVRPRVRRNFAGAAGPPVTSTSSSRAG